MQFYELRKIISKNKKYKYIYELVIDGVAVSRRKTSSEYAGCRVLDNKPHRYFTEQSTTFVLCLRLKPNEGVALTFDTLLNLKSLST